MILYSTSILIINCLRAAVIALVSLHSSCEPSLFFYTIIQGLKDFVSTNLHIAFWRGIFLTFTNYCIQ